MPFAFSVYPTKQLSEREPCTCSPTLKVCPACREWARNNPIDASGETQEAMRRYGRLRVRYANGDIAMTHFSRELIEKVRDLKQTGLSLRKIGAILHKNFKTVGKVSRMSIIEEVV